MSSAPSWRLEDLPGGVRRLTLFNPDKSNALDEGLLEQLAGALSASKNSSVGALLLQSAGPRVFCSGFDLTSLSSGVADASLPDQRLGEIMRMLATHPLPSVALVHGGAFGAGCELAAACDFRVGTSQAKFCMPPARLGVVYAAEGMARVARHVGPGFARWMFLTAHEVDAAQALRVGLLNEVHAELDAAAAAALALAQKLASHAPLAMAGMKRTLEALEEGCLPDDVRQELETKRRAAFASEDFREGRSAFLEKRTPRFHGR